MASAPTPTRRTDAQPHWNWRRWRTAPSSSAGAGGPRTSRRPSARSVTRARPASTSSTPRRPTGSAAPSGCSAGHSPPTTDCSAPPPVAPLRRRRLAGAQPGVHRARVPALSGRRRRARPGRRRTRRHHRPAGGGLDACPSTVQVAILGSRTPAHLQESLGALGLRLSGEGLAEIDASWPLQCRSAAPPRKTWRESCPASPSGLRTLHVVGEPAGPDHLADTEGHFPATSRRYRTISPRSAEQPPSPARCGRRAVGRRGHADAGGLACAVGTVRPVTAGTTGPRCRGRPPAATPVRGPDVPGRGGGAHRDRGCWESRIPAGCGRPGRRPGAARCGGTA